MVHHLVNSAMPLEQNSLTTYYFALSTEASFLLLTDIQLSILFSNSNQLRDSLSACSNKRKSAGIAICKSKTRTTLPVINFNNVF